MPLIAREIAKPSVIAAISTLIGFFMKSLLIIFLLQQKSEHRGSWVERNPNRRLCLGSLVPCPSSLVLSTEPTAPCLPGHSAIGSGTRFQSADNVPPSSPARLVAPSAQKRSGACPRPARQQSTHQAIFLLSRPSKICFCNLPRSFRVSCASVRYSFADPSGILRRRARIC